MQWMKLTKYLANFSAYVTSFVNYLNLQALCCNDTSLPASAGEHVLEGLVFILLL